jgi:hypothetical protein
MKRERFTELVKEYLTMVQPAPTDDERFRLLDCALALPTRYIPDRSSLAWFVAGFVEHFLEREQDFCLHHSRAAHWMTQWKEKWLEKDFFNNGKKQEESPLMERLRESAR